MKKTFLAVIALAGLAVATPALAQSSTSSASNNDSQAFYAFVGVGQANMGINQTELDTAVSTALGGAVSSTLANTGVGYTLGAGYQFCPYLSAEFSYANFGTLSYNNPSSTPTVGVDFQPHSYNVFAVGKLPMGHRFSVYGKIGVAFTQLSANTNELQTYTTTFNKTNAAFGGGVEMKLGRYLAIQGEYDYFGTAGNPPDFVNNLGTGTGSLGMFTVNAVFRIPTH